MLSTILICSFKECLPQYLHSRPKNMLKIPIVLNFNNLFDDIDKSRKIESARLTCQTDFSETSVVFIKQGFNALTYKLKIPEIVQTHSLKSILKIQPNSSTIQPNIVSIMSPCAIILYFIIYSTSLAFSHNPSLTVPSAYFIIPYPCGPSSFHPPS